MVRIKKFASDFKYELAVAGVLLIKLLCEALYIKPGSWLILIGHYALAALLTARFIKSVDESNRRSAQGFAALFLVFFAVTYHYSLTLFAQITAAEQIATLLFFASLYCLSFDGLALACVPLAVAGAAVDRTFTVTCLPALIAVSAFVGGGLFAKKAQKSNKQKKRESKKGKPSMLARLAAYDRFTSPLLIAVLAASAIRYAFTYDKGLGFFSAEAYYIAYNRKYLFYLIPLVAVIGALIRYVRGNRKAVGFFAALLCTVATAVVMAKLFDFGIIHFRQYIMCATYGVFAGIFALSARSDVLGADVKQAACSFIKKAYPLVMVISLLSFCVVVALITR